MVGNRSGIQTPLYFKEYKPREAINPKLPWVIASWPIDVHRQTLTFTNTGQASEHPASEFTTVYLVCTKLFEHQRVRQIRRIRMQKNRIPDWFCYNPGRVTSLLNSMIVSFITIKKTVMRIKWNNDCESGKVLENCF